MSDNEILINDFSDNYMEKIFYFCLRKTGGEYEAEDLTQDIALSVISELRRGIIPDNFSAWIWQITRNRYARWAKYKHMRAEAETGTDIGEYELADDTTLEAEYIHREDLSKLRCELAFISSEYRNVVVAYYIEDRGVKEIAKTLSLPEGTVKSKLFRARNILKEGMNMAREFGALSYKPEDISFIKNGHDGTSGEPWSLVDRKICKNILLAAYRTPSTAEELAMELGIALPYMEDELKTLVRSTLMKKNGDKYETAIIIVSKSAEEKIVNDLLNIAPALSSAVIEALEYRTKCLDARGVKWHGGYQDYEDMKWALLMQMTSYVSHSAVGKVAPDSNKVGRTSRPNCGEWDLLGIEKYSGACPKFVGLHTVGVNFRQYKFEYKNIDTQTPAFINDNAVNTIWSIATGNTEGLFPELIDDLLSYGYLRNAEDGYEPTMAVFNCDINGLLTEDEKAEFNRLCDKAIDIAAAHYTLCRELVHAEVPSFMKNETHQIEHACSTLLFFRGAVLEESLRTGYLTYNDGETEAKDRMLGAYLYI